MSEKGNLHCRYCYYIQSPLLGTVTTEAISTPPPLAILGWKAMGLTFNLAPSYRDLKDPTSRQNFYDTVEQKRVIDL